MALGTTLDLEAPVASAQFILPLNLFYQLVEGIYLYVLTFQCRVEKDVASLAGGAPLQGHPSRFIYLNHTHHYIDFGVRAACGELVPLVERHPVENA